MKNEILEQFKRAGTDAVKDVANGRAHTKQAKVLRAWLDVHQLDLREREEYDNEERYTGSEYVVTKMDLVTVVASFNEGDILFLS